LFSRTTSFAVSGENSSRAQEANAGHTGRSGRGSGEGHPRRLSCRPGCQLQGRLLPVSAGYVPDIEGKSFFLVDPLDGTKEFVGRNDDFTVNIALIEKGEPVAGVVYAPALGILYAASRNKAKKAVVSGQREIGPPTIIGCRSRGDRLVALASRSHNSQETIAYLAEHGITDYESIGSSLKFCLLAEGLADIYPRLSRTMEWDTAAGDAVLRAAGGETVTMDGNPLFYGKRNQAHDVDFANPHFVSRGKH
jgi:3'(2'), 5'-bisphosphate nucleotidase